MDDKGDPGFDTWYGTGRVNARKALDYLRAPYTLLHKSASGGSEHSHTSYFLITFYGVPGIADGTYLVKRYDVRKTVNWSETLEDVHIWGRGVGVGTNGYSLKNPNFAMGWCEVISHNNSSATLRTYVYDVWERGTWRHVGWKPTSPSNVSFNYTVLGEEPPVDPLSVTISGPSYLPFKESAICTANVSGGSPPISYQWYKKIGQGSWISLWTSSTQSITMGMDDITMKVVVTDYFDLTDEDTHLIETGIFKPAADEEATLSIPDKHTVAQNYPNPFNPETQIRFGLPEDSKVTIEVFNLQGRKVATLADGYYEAGYHSVTFNGAKHPSGVYFYRTVAGEFQDIKRMLLIK